MSDLDTWLKAEMSRQRRTKWCLTMWSILVFVVSVALIIWGPQ